MMQQWPINSIALHSAFSAAEISILRPVPTAPRQSHRRDNHAVAPPTFALFCSIDCKTALFSLASHTRPAL